MQSRLGYANKFKGRWAAFNMQCRLGYANQFWLRWAESNMQITLGRLGVIYKLDSIGLSFICKVD